MNKIYGIKWFPRKKIIFNCWLFRMRLPRTFHMPCDLFSYVSSWCTWWVMHSWSDALAEWIYLATCPVCVLAVGLRYIPGPEKRCLFGCRVEAFKNTCLPLTGSLDRAALRWPFSSKADDDCFAAVAAICGEGTTFWFLLQSSRSSEQGEKHNFLGIPSSCIWLKTDSPELRSIIDWRWAILLCSAQQPTARSAPHGRETRVLF